MTDQLWYVAVGGNREGPISEAELQARIAGGQIGPDTLVWNQSMTNWTKAGAIPGLLPETALAVAPLPAALPGAPQVADGGQTGAPLATTIRTWPLLGRTLVLVICQFLIIPSPWATTSFYRWLIDRITLPNGKAVTFEGKPGDIWYVFMLMALLSYGGYIYAWVPIVLLPITAFLTILVIRWVCANLRWQGQSGPLQFTGSYLAQLGWMALTYVSLVTIIGWAWVLTANMRWLCRNIQGSSLQLSYVASGWSVLWRTFLFAFACMFIIPIPWVLRWYLAWTISQLHLSRR